MSKKEEGLLTVAEVAAARRVAPATVRQAIREGRLRGYRFGRRLLVRPSDLEAATREVGAEVGLS